MAITEASRYQLHQQLEDAVGKDAANTLVEHLPPVGWADVATRPDLAQLEERVGLRCDALEAKMLGALANGLRQQFIQLLTSMAVLLTLAVTIDQLLG